MSYPSFDEAYKSGSEAEDEVLEIIQKKYPRAHRTKGYFKEYDIYVPETDDKIEVKRDKCAVETGNFFVETMYDDKPSGIETTESSFWVWVDNELTIWIRTEALRYLIQDKKGITFEANGKKSRGGKIIGREELIFSQYVNCYERPSQHHLPNL